MPLSVFGLDRSNAALPQNLRLCVLVDAFPELSETFVGAEAAALARSGRAVTVEARRRPAHPGAAPAGLAVRYVEDESRLAQLVALGWLVARHPGRCWADWGDRRAWAAEEPVESLRRLAVRAWRLRGVHLHAHFARVSALDALRLRRLLGVTTSVVAHGWDVFADPRNLRAKLVEADIAIAPCEYTARHLRALSGRADIETVVMGVDGDVFRRRAPHPGTRHVVAVGRLVEKKGFINLVRAAAQLPDVTVTIAGDGPQRAALEAEAPERVTFLGAAAPDEVRALLERADLLAMPSVIAADGDRDAMPVVVKEALAMEVCVVASDEVGLPEIVREPWGRLVPPGDPALLARAIEALLARDVEERAAAGRAGRTFVLEHASVEREAAKVSALISRASASSRAR
jgi:colanic acid/amylovoran biosynthesis glycosyltransferase